MKLLEIWNEIKKITKKPDIQIRDIDKEDPYATIKHKTKTLGFRSYKAHNNRKRTRGRHVQYTHLGKFSKPIYHHAL